MKRIFTAQVSFTLPADSKEEAEGKLISFLETCPALPDGWDATVNDVDYFEDIEEEEA